MRFKTTILHNKDKISKPLECFFKEKRRNVNLTQRTK